MPNRNVDKGREAENATAKVLVDAGMLHAERRTKRGGVVELADGTVVPADAGDITGVPGLVVQVKWSPYQPLAAMLLRTEQQRQVARADIGLLVVKRPGVGLARAGEWDAYLPQWALARLFATPACEVRAFSTDDVWRTDLATAARLISRAGYGDTDRWTQADYDLALS